MALLWRLGMNPRVGFSSCLSAGLGSLWAVGCGLRAAGCGGLWDLWDLGDSG